MLECFLIFIKQVGENKSTSSSPTQFCRVGKAGGEVQQGEQGEKEFFFNNAFSPPASPASSAYHHAKFPWQTTSLLQKF
ncbi:hypothetical protein FNW02_21600 [Komarekiella sp. 'clone 1']|uniref:Uncharacterized protein n=1 Tax=Komarekiella delphini-convector SJRDD-AB1 TaxID=2593771 RepID=A0AA40VTD0_9NOST|nr:hypothetical protein [Komarekiella delphini-convector]MBD6618346.1 hypothetical protein [Komarekiella delphini-convector SJRDD-AB1]